MYSQSSPTDPRGNRISFYVFNLATPARAQNEGIGSYFQDQVVSGEWIHVVGVADCQRTAIYGNGVLRRCDQYRDSLPPLTEDQWLKWDMLKQPCPHNRPYETNQSEEAENEWRRKTMPELRG